MNYFDSISFQRKNCVYEKVCDIILCFYWRFNIDVNDSYYDSEDYFL